MSEVNPITEDGKMYLTAKVNDVIQQIEYKDNFAIMIDHSPLIPPEQRKGIPVWYKTDIYIPRKREHIPVEAQDEMTYEMVQGMSDEDIARYIFRKIEKVELMVAQNMFAYKSKQIMCEDIVW